MNTASFTAVATKRGDGVAYKCSGVLDERAKWESADAEGAAKVWWTRKLPAVRMHQIPPGIPLLHSGLLIGRRHQRLANRLLVALSG